MMALTLTQCFGDGASQNNNYLIINKNQLPGLTPLSANTAESLVVGILLKVLQNFEGSMTDENGNAITTEDNQILTCNQGDIANAFYLFYWRLIFRKKNDISYKIHQLVLQEFQIYT